MTGRERQQQIEALVAEAYREWESLGLMSYHGDGNGGWWADLDKDGIAQIRGTINALAARLSGLQDTLTKKDEILREIVDFNWSLFNDTAHTVADLKALARAALALNTDGGDA